MKLKYNLNLRLLYQSAVLSVVGATIFFGGAYLAYLLLSLMFSSVAVFFSLFGLVVGLGVLFLHDSDLFQWDQHGRIAIKRQMNPSNEDRDDE